MQRIKLHFKRKHEHEQAILYYTLLNIQEWRGLWRFRITKTYNTYIFKISISSWKKEPNCQKTSAETGRSSWVWLWVPAALDVHELDTSLLLRDELYKNYTNTT